jgi:mannose-6-phosphate isomerase-like protein (cupin superfamily)
VTVHRLLSWDDLDGSDRARVLEGASAGVAASFFVVAAPPGHGPDLHRHPYDELFFVQDGSARFTAGDEELDARPGQILLVGAGTAHRFVNTGSGRLRMITVHCAPRMETEWLDEN